MQKAGTYDVVLCLKENVLEIVYILKKTRIFAFYNRK
jgi:hypothetical protein